jgi:hypothetical protein
MWRRRELRMMRVEFVVGPIVVVAIIIIIIILNISYFAGNERLSTITHKPVRQLDKHMLCRHS